MTLFRLNVQTKIGIADAREGGFKGKSALGKNQAQTLESLTLAKVVSKLGHHE